MALGQVPGSDAEPDGIEEAFEASVRLAVTAGARIGSEIARAREEQHRGQRRLVERASQQLTERVEVEKSAAIAELSQVHRADWWELAGRDGGADRIGQAYATAVAWAPQSEEAARAERTMRQELRDRYGIDLDGHGRNSHGRAGLNRSDLSQSTTQLVSAEVEVWRQRLEEQRRVESERELRGTSAEQVEAAVLLDQAAREERRADAQAGGLSEAREPAYDSAERRSRDRDNLETQGVAPDLAKSRIRSDTGYATPATYATAGSTRRRPSAPKARRTRSAQLQLPGMER